MQSTHRKHTFHAYPVTSGHVRSLELYLCQEGVRVVRSDLPPGVHGRTLHNLIVLREGLDPEQELLALVHELTHWLAHRGSGDCDVRRTVFEYEAEAVEAVVMDYLGLQCPATTLSPLERQSPTDDLLLASVERVHLTSRRICNALGSSTNP
jgi:hypothetical protein